MTGDLNGTFRVFDAVNGAELYTRAVGGPIGGGVITYGVEGRQFIAIAHGMNSPIWPWKGGPARITVLGLH